MGTRKTRTVPGRLEKVQRRFERWRRTRETSSRIPDSLWAVAVKLADRYGISHTAKTLRVNYNALRKRVEHQAAAAPRGPEEGAADQCFASVPAFLEVARPARTGSCQCTLELENASGAKMRVHLQSGEAPDLAALSRSFWEGRS